MRFVLVNCDGEYFVAGNGTPGDTTPQLGEASLFSFTLEDARLTFFPNTLPVTGRWRPVAVDVVASAMMAVPALPPPRLRQRLRDARRTDGRIADPAPEKESA